jgi:hypothetical protein
MVPGYSNMHKMILADSYIARVVESFEVNTFFATKKAIWDSGWK